MYSPKTYWKSLAEHVLFSNTSPLLWNWAFKAVKQAPEAKHKSKVITYRPVISAFCKILLAAKSCFQSYEAVTLYSDGAEKYKRIKKWNSSQSVTLAENKLSLSRSDLLSLNKRNFIKHSETDELFWAQYLLCPLLWNGSCKCFNKYMEQLSAFTVAFVNAHVSSAETLFCNFSFTESQQVPLCHLQQCTRGNIPLLSSVLHTHQYYRSWILNLFTRMPTDPVFTVEIWSK